MRKLLCLASVLGEKEDTCTLKLFWSTLIKMLSSHSGIDFKFNPCGLVADEHHANWLSISSIFGESAISKTVSCEFHFKQSVERHSKKLLSHNVPIFKKLADDWLSVLTLEAYDEATSNLEEFCGTNESLGSWFSWWCERSSHICKLYKPHCSKFFTFSGNDGRGFVLQCGQRLSFVYLRGIRM